MSSRPNPRDRVVRLKGAVRRLADFLPPPRDEALLGVAREAWALLTGKPGRTRGRAVRAAGPGIRPEPWLNPMEWRRARSAYDQGAYDIALERVDGILARHPGSFKALSLKKDIHNRRGDMSDVVATYRRMRHVQDDPATEYEERQWLGRLVETDPRWLPRIAGPARPIEPRDDRTVMHLLKESVPYLQNGFTMRSRYTLLSQRDAGLDPFVVTSLGFPRKEGVDRFPSTDILDGITHYRLDLGPGYPTDQPFDRLLTDYAWLAAKVARRERPAIIHASSGFRGYETALVGMALRDHLRIPLVYEVRSFFESTWTADHDRAELTEHYRRRYDTENRAMRSADAVITIGEAMREDIADRGVPMERIHLMPNGVDPASFEPQEPDPELVRRYRLAGKTVFGYVSNLDHPREGQEILIEATAKLLARGRKVACLIVGDGARRGELEGLARRASVGEAVVFTGRVPHDEVRAHYALLDVFVVPRRNDRAARFVTPLKPFEAMSMAKPLIVSDLPALVEIAAPGERGLAFPHGDADGLADALETLIDQPEMRRLFGDAGRAWVLAERTWGHNGERYREIYRDVLNRWRTGAEAQSHRAEPLRSVGPVAAG
ncbi:MAG: glycosyltransferase family 4 protein [Chloroflexota bacterium]|nr:glycosyltransferase family 4 protein [Chloroflexota bacterium]